MDKIGAAPDPTDIQRVLLPLPPPATDAAVVRAITRLAGQLRAEILGLFFKDEAVVRGAAVPFSNEVRRLPAAVVESTPQDAERQFQALARRMEALLRRGARESGIRGRLQVVTGTAAETVWAASAEGDLIVLGEPARSPRETSSLLESLVGNGRCPVLVVRPRHRLPPSVIAVVFRPAPEGERTLRMAGQMARRLGRAAVTLLALEDDATRSGDANEHARWLSETYGIAVSVSSLKALSLPEFARILPTADRSLLVVPGAFLQPAMGSMLRTLRALPGPFLVTP